MTYPVTSALALALVLNVIFKAPAQAQTPLSPGFILHEDSGFFPSNNTRTYVVACHPRRSAVTLVTRITQGTRGLSFSFEVGDQDIFVTRTLAGDTTTWRFLGQGLCGTIYRQ